MKKQYGSRLMAAVHETAEGLHDARLMDKRTMRKFDELCLTLMKRFEVQWNEKPSYRLM